MMVRLLVAGAAVCLASESAVDGLLLLAGFDDQAEPTAAKAAPVAVASEEDAAFPDATAEMAPAKTQESSPPTWKAATMRAKSFLSMVAATTSTGPDVLEQFNDAGKHAWMDDLLTGAGPRTVAPSLYQQDAVTPVSAALLAAAGVSQPIVMPHYTGDAVASARAFLEQAAGEKLQDLTAQGDGDIFTEAQGQ
mmetsp:Transcript_56777/g.124507  ORF Transcript_56777/g.124507 Transcript_56777/m.124507 type:complete len:193 (-) Transcript_56777:38-616(-)|eukprot:CAMPEP_0204269566 /NCGR_PEP_ID=MMETSP0468-20130131/16502_1 /ASSEMBLY_ACC=CAM_ASM_000383 /TAXON_ID=2969 /ORGANISM="Oxyrrhis marina" /LENGTH=192 /DNA_ID=CAMNT_0051244967 /DNA_START=125 /DNA_END=703 /DNA_ORIENTATION=-